MPFPIDIAGNPGATLARAFLRQVEEADPRRVRTPEYFGARAVDFDETPIDNHAAMTTAYEWSSETGGLIAPTGGLYGVDGTLLLLPYVSMMGTCGFYNTMFKQLSVATSALGTYLPLMETPSEADGGGFGSFLANMHLHGGWDSLREYEGASGSGNWSYDVTAKNVPVIRYMGPEEGPDHADLRPLDIGQSDTHHTTHMLQVTNAAGPFIEASGRGEHVHSFFKGRKAASFGLDIRTIDITQVIGGSTSVCGDTGVKCSGGAYMMIGHKTWFNGLNRFAEPDNSEGYYGAGFHFEGIGKILSQVVACASQDTYGPSLITEGRNHRIEMLCDEAGGGRLQNSGLGWEAQHTRTATREFIHLNGCNSNTIRAVLGGGARTATAPQLVKATGGSTDMNDVQMTAQTNGTEFAYNTSNPLNMAGGVSNNGQWNKIMFHDHLLWGRVTTAQLLDANHRVNLADRGPSFVHLQGGGFATKAEDGVWTDNTGTTYTPVAA